MKLPSRIDFNFTTLSEVTLQPNEDGGKSVMVVTVPLTPQIAESLCIKEQFYTEKGIAREFTGSVGLPCEQADTDVKLKIDEFEEILKPEKIRGFKVSNESSGEGTQLVLSFRMHFSTGDAMDKVYSFFQETNKNSFGCALVSKQGELFPSNEEEKQEQAGCKLCDADVDLNDDGTQHVTSDGELVPCLHPSAKAAKGVLASKADMGRIEGAATSAVKEIRAARQKRPVVQ